MQLDSLPFGDRFAGAADTVITIVLIVILAAIVARLARLFVHGIVKTLLDREATEGTAQELSAAEVRKRMSTIESLVGRVVLFFVVVIAGLMILEQFNLNIGPAIAGLGVVGVAVGFGAQHLVKDYLNGILILVENQFAEGDVVRIAGVSGMVEDFSLRRTTLRDLDGVVHTVPNGEIAVASNQTRTWARVNLDVSVAYGTEIDRAIEVVNEVGRGLAEDPDWGPRILEPPQVLRIEELGEYGVTFKILGSVRALEQWSVGGELRRRILAAFETHDIEIPLPHRVVISRPAPGYTALEEPATGDGRSAE